MNVTSQGPTIEKVIGEFSSVFQNKGLDPPALSSETILDGSLGLESLDFAELVVRLEQVFGKDPFAGDSIPEVRTLADLAVLYEPR
jgi:acyl carrier protein